MDCYCDNETPDFYHSARPVARKTHRCNECGRTIEPGERYERVRGKWGGEVGTVRACCYCLSLRDQLDMRPCFCWSHNGLADDVFAEIMDGDWQPGRKFEFLRLLSTHPVLGRRRSKGVRCS